DGDEVRGRGELDVHVQPLLEDGDRSIDIIAFGHDFHVDVDRARTPAMENGCCPACEVHLRLSPRVVAERPHEAADPRPARGVAHFAARSKLTSRLMSALYRPWAESESSIASRS